MDIRFLENYIMETVIPQFRGSTSCHGLRTMEPCLHTRWKYEIDLECHIELIFLKLSK